MANINHLEPYTALSEVYQAAGFAAYSVDLAARLLGLAFEMDWTGRTLVDLGCGTGDLACWFGEHGFRATGIDTSAAMLRYGTASAQSSGVDVQFDIGDMRTFKPAVSAEMVTCVGGTLNYIPTLRDLESVFRQANAALQPGKLFLFDLRTIKGLSDAEHAEQIVYDNGNDILILARNIFNYETLQLTTQYTILRYTDHWQRAEETHTWRGYPLQAVLSLLSKTGFKLLRQLTPDMEFVEGRRDIGQMVFVALKEG
jgi:SAM-dependent methyltransferase